MKWVFILCWMVFGGLGAQAREKKPQLIEHQVLERETLWFLAALYYGKAQDYKKMMESNHFQKPEEVEVGMRLQISEPKFWPDQQDFADRYRALWDQRELALLTTAEKRVRESAKTELEKRETAKLDSDFAHRQFATRDRKIVNKQESTNKNALFSIEKILQLDSVRSLPFNEVSVSSPSPLERARQEQLRDIRESSMDHGQ